MKQGALEPALSKKTTPVTVTLPEMKRQSRVLARRPTGKFRFYFLNVHGGAMTPRPSLGWLSRMDWLPAATFLRTAVACRGYKFAMRCMAASHGFEP